MNRDPEIVIHIPLEYDGVELQDLRNNCRIGTLRQSCVQYGISVNTSGESLELKSKRKKMQKFMEILHFSGLPYTIIN